MFLAAEYYKSQRRSTSACIYATMSQHGRESAILNSQSSVLYSTGRADDGRVPCSDIAPAVLPLTFAKSPPIYLSPTEFDMTDLTVSSEGVISSSTRHGPLIVINGQPQQRPADSHGQTRDALLQKMHLNLSALE